VRHRFESYISILAVFRNSLDQQMQIYHNNHDKCQHSFNDTKFCGLFFAGKQHYFTFSWDTDIL